MAGQGEGTLDKMPCQLSLPSTPKTAGTSLQLRWGQSHHRPPNNNCLILEEERAIVPGVQIRAATIEALVEHLIQSFECLGGIGVAEENNHFPRVMLLMHQWFVSSQDLAKLLMDLFWRSEKVLDCPTSCPHKFESQPKCEVYEYRGKICHVFRLVTFILLKIADKCIPVPASFKMNLEPQRYWICCFPIHFDLDPALATNLHKFQQLLRERGHLSLADLVDLSKIPSFEWTRNVSVRNPLAKHTRKVSLVFDHLEPNELADHLTYLEHKVMSKISFMDFKNYAMSGTLQDNPKLERSISLFNGMTQWIQCMVLSRSLPQQRADVIEKFVLVSKRLLEMNNFNTLMAVVGGLSHSALARLHQTRPFITPETKKSLADLTELLASNANFSNYRKILSDSKGFRIPVLGVHMKDLISLHTALPDKVESGLINFRKVAHLSLIFQELWELQNSSPPIDVSLDLVNTLKLCLDMAYTEDEIYELSLKQEPRHMASPQSSPTKPTMFSDWASGLCSGPDADTLERHIQAVVEAVFKKYDADQDGYITHKEFEGIASNFSFIDTFADLDLDQDGLISKTEMKQYFMQANCHALKNGFRHNFHETTYFKPTFCAHCTGLLWGLIKQGSKCKDCGINAHKHCKDLVVMECARGVAGRSNSFTAGDGSTIKVRIQRHLRRQHKNSQSDGSEPSGLGRKLSLDIQDCTSVAFCAVPTSPLVTFSTAATAAAAAAIDQPSSSVQQISN